MTHPELRESALRYAAAGIPVFPCVPNGKAPACPHGVWDATTDPGQIGRWWTENPLYNIGIRLEDKAIAVIDLDVKTHDGVAAWRALAGDKPPTHTVATPSGGRHFYYQGELRASVNRLAPGIDTRGLGSYVLAPPSLIDGNRYLIVDDAPMAPLPAWIPAALQWNRTKHEALDDIELDAPATLAWAAQVLAEDLAEHGTPEIGAYSDERTFHLIGRLLDGPAFGQSLHRATIADLLFEHWAPHFDHEWLAHKADICGYQNQPGCGPAGSDDRRYGALLATLPDDVSPPRGETSPKPSRFAAVDLLAAMRRPPPVYWDAHRLLLRQEGGAVSLIYAAFSNYKSTWTANYLLAVIKATGCRVLYVLGEGAGGFAPLTVAAAIESWNADHADDPVTAEWLRDRLRLVEAMPQLYSDADMIEFMREHRDWRPDFVVLDTLGNAMAGRNLSAIEEGTLLGRNTRLLAQALQANVLLLHHEGKDGKATGSQYIAGNDPDLVLHLEHDAAKRLLSVTVDKDRWGEPRRRVCFGTRAVLVGTREFVATHELTSEDRRTPANAAEDATARLRDHAQRVYRHVCARLDAGETTGWHHNSLHSPAAIAGLLGLAKAEADAALGYCEEQDWLARKKDPARYERGNVTPLFKAAVY